MPQTQRVLDVEEVKRIQAIMNRDSRPRVEHWPPKHYKPLILNAILSNRAKTVKLDGRVFAIKYYENDKVWLQLADGTFGACGWFDINSLKKEIEVDNA